MDLRYDLEIRAAAGGILPDGAGIDAGNGWRSLISTAIAGIAQAAGDRVTIRKVGEKMGYLDLRLAVRELPRETINAVYGIAGQARAQSGDICELCGRPGEIRRTGWHRVRCDGCEDEHPRRRRFMDLHRNDIDEAAAHYIGVCLEHGRLFPVANIALQAWPDDVDRRHFIDAVNDAVSWWRAGSWIERVGDEPREAFRGLRFP